MKKILNLISIIVLLFFASCKKDDAIFKDNTPVQNFPSIVMGNQSAASFNCFLTFDSCKVKPLAQAFTDQSIVDLIFLHNNPDNLAMLVSPASIASAVTIPPDIYTFATMGVTHWTNKNSIQIGVTDISLGDFNNIATNGDLHQAYENDPHVTIGWEIDIQANKVYKFTSNRTGKRGLIKVHSITGNYNTPGQINIDIKLIN